MISLDHDLKEKTSNIILEVCLSHLVATKKVSEKQIKSRVYIRWDRSFMLSPRGHAAGTTQDNQGSVVLIMNPDLPVDQLVWCILHEATHVAQVCRGDMLFPQEGGIIWEGAYFEPLSAEDLAYFDQPWEAEAKGMEHEMLVAVREEYPELAEMLEAMQGTTDIAD